MANSNQELLTPIKTIKVTNNDVIADGEYGSFYIYLRHDLDIENNKLIVNWFDENGNLRSHTGNIKYLDRNTVLIYVGSEITGTHTIIILQDKSNVLKGRRLFDQPLIDAEQVDESYRIAIGRPGFETKNISISDLSNSMSNLMGNTYLRVENNLSDVASASISRTNLNVYSTNETDTYFLRKDDPTNLNILSHFVPASYQDNQNPAKNDILTYGLAQRLEHKKAFTALNNAPWIVDEARTAIYTSALSSMMKFNICAGLYPNQVENYGYTYEVYVYDEVLANKFPDSLDGTFIFACEGMPIYDLTTYRVNLPSVTSHLQVKLDKENGRFMFYLLNTIAGSRDVAKFVFQGTILIPD